MKRTLLAAGVAILSGFSACGNPAEPCTPDVLSNAAQVCPDRSSLGFNQEFGSGTTIGTSVPNALSVHNGGVADLNVTSVVLAGDPAFTLKTSPEMFPAAIKGNKDLLVTVYFAPTEARAYSGQITIVSDAENEPTLVIGVSGCGVPSDGGTSPCYRDGGLAP